MAAELEVNTVSIIIMPAINAIIMTSKIFSELQFDFQSTYTLKFMIQKLILTFTFTKQP